MYLWTKVQVLLVSCYTVVTVVWVMLKVILTASENIKH